MIKNNYSRTLVAWVLAVMLVPACANHNATSGSTSTGGGSGTASSRTLTDNQSNVQAVTTAYGGTCEELSRSASSCASARAALGLTGNWLSFSCNVVLGLATASGVATTTFADAVFVTISTVSLPDYASNYYPTSGSYSFIANSFTVTGTFDSLHSTYTPNFPDPGTIGSQSITMSIPLSPAFSAGSQTMAGGAVGVAINGVAIFDSLAANTDNIFAEAGSFDQCQGHPAGTKYHYHSEPYSISYNDNHLIGVMRDGYFIYGRQDHDGTSPGTTANLEAGGTSSTIYKYGGHTGLDPLSNSGSTFHYHLTEWQGCYHESGSTKSADDGETDDTLNSGSPTCGGSWVDAWFMSGHGNGGAFMSVPSGLGSQSPSQTTAGVRYYYGTPGSCSGC